MHIIIYIYIYIHTLICTTWQTICVADELARPARRGDVTGAPPVNANETTG